MSAIGFTPISLYYSTTPSAVPAAGDLTLGELAINIADGNLYYKDPGNVVQQFTGSVGNVPTGGISMWAVSTAPAGYLICDGSEIDRTTYASLFGIIGTEFGAGDGVDTFNLPDYTNYFPVGAGGNYTVATTGGSEDTVLPDHTHTATAASTVNDPGHQHYSYTSGAPNGGGAGQALTYYQGGSGPTPVQPAGTGITVSTSVTVDPTGVDPTGTNIPPFLAIYFIIKT